jgi:hypothetical protein
MVDRRGRAAAMVHRRARSGAMVDRRGRSAVMVARLVTAEATVRRRRAKGTEEDRAISVDLRGRPVDQLLEEWVTLVAQRSVPGSEASEDRDQGEWEAQRPEFVAQEARKAELAAEDRRKQG